MKNFGLSMVFEIGDDRTNAAVTRRLPICLCIIALVRDNGAGIDVRTEVEEHFEVAAVARFAAGQMEADRIAVGLETDPGRELSRHPGRNIISSAVPKRNKTNVAPKIAAHG